MDSRSSGGETGARAWKERCANRKASSDEGVLPKKNGPEEEEEEEDEESLAETAACAATASESTLSRTADGSGAPAEEPKNRAETPFRVERGISEDSGNGSPAEYSLLVNSS